MTTDLRHRIDATFARDRVWALLMVISLWLVVAVVFFGIQSHISTPGIKLVLAVAALLVLAFNSASILAMLSHYESDKDFIYGLDLRHLDAGKSRQSNQ